MHETKSVHYERTFHVQRNEVEKVKGCRDGVQYRYTAQLCSVPPTIPAYLALGGAWVKEKYNIQQKD